MLGAPKRCIQHNCLVASSGSRPHKIYLCDSGPVEMCTAKVSLSAGLLNLSMQRARDVSSHDEHLVRTMARIF